MWILDAIFGSPKTTGTVVDAAVKGLDAIVFTEEERSAANAQFRDWYIKYLEASQPQNLARRLISMMVTFMWMLLIVVAVAIYPLNQPYAQFIFEVMKEYVLTPFGIIIAFYFATHVVRALPSNK